MKRKVVGVVENHFDQIWRRCFKRDIVWNGWNIISYEKIERNYIEANLKLAAEIPGYKFQIENICALETYLEHAPEKKELFKKLYADGILKTMNTGYVILDSNIISPESMIRNYLISDTFFAEYTGKTPAIADRSDAFGNSAQLVQILRAFGAEYVTELYYNTVKNEDVWIGLDGSAICVTKPEPQGSGGSWGKYPPCPTCRGFGTVDGKVCPTCAGECVDDSIYEKKWNKFTINPYATTSGVCRIGGEELKPNPKTPEHIRQASLETGIDAELGHLDFLLECCKEQIDKVNRGDFSGLVIKPEKEYNPNTTGGFTTRIKIKQRLTDAENKILAGETLEAMRWISDKEPFSYDRIWRNFLLNGFHDSASGTIVDKGYDEIMDMFDEIDAVVTERYLSKPDGDAVILFNPTSSPYNGTYESAGRIARVQNLAPYGFGRFTFMDDPEFVKAKPAMTDTLQEVVLTGADNHKASTDDGEIFAVENEFFTIEADERGLRRIIDKRTGVLCETVDNIRPGEWILQTDTGSPWAALEPPTSTFKLKSHTTYTGIKKGESFTKICFHTDIPISVSGTAAFSNGVNWSVTLFDGYDRIRFDADVIWYTAGRRLITAFPMRIENSRDIYGIPGGWLERAPYTPSYSWNGADGDWPAYRFGGVESENKSVAILNRGTPAYRILPVDGTKIVYMTVLRSPTIPVCLHEPDAYTMTEYDGMRDEGEHSFTYELASYDTVFAKSGVIRDAEQFSRKPLCVDTPIADAALPEILSGTASITHIKPAENGDGILVRITENEGRDGNIELSVPEWATRVSRTGMSEKEDQPLTFGKTLVLPVRGFEIASVRFSRK